LDVYIKRSTNPLSPPDLAISTASTMEQELRSLSHLITTYGEAIVDQVRLPVP
jgi:hypothetical protein